MDTSDKNGVFKRCKENEARILPWWNYGTGHAGLDAPQDHAFITQIDNYSQQLGVKYILNGYNISTEIITDSESWFEGPGPTADKTYNKDV
ncbi:MAG: hypothetical protein M0R37_00290 [Bacteroidales bacterium]|nr:hypothetical protein [Bacteroidales bacterium]